MSNGIRCKEYATGVSTNCAPLGLPKGEHFEVTFGWSATVSPIRYFTAWVKRMAGCPLRVSIQVT